MTPTGWMSCAAIAAIAAGAWAQANPKQIAAPPEHVRSGVLDLPDPSDTGVESTSAMFPIRFEGDQRSMWRTDVPIDAGDAVRLLVLAPDADTWRVRLDLPDGDVVALREDPRSIGVIAERGDLRIGSGVHDATTFTLLDRAPGNWSVSVEAPPTAGDARGVDGYLLVESSSDRSLYTCLSTHELLVGRRIGLRSFMRDATGERLDGLIESGEVELGWPTGETTRHAMKPDGQDYVAGFTPTMAGAYTARAVVRGRHESGVAFVRTTQHIVPVLADEIELGGGATLVADVPGVYRFELETERATRRERVIVSGEVWSVTQDGERPICWLSRMATPNENDGRSTYTLYLDHRWLAGTSGAIELRDVRVQCCDTLVPLARSERLGVAVDASVVRPEGRVEVSEDMLVGRPRADLAMPIRQGGAERRSRAFAGHNLMLVHGYCSSLVWAPADFSGAFEVFADPDANRSHDEFANLLLSFGNASKSFGVVAHSQGGAAALHLRTYYFSGLDWAEGPRLIQSVGTPYQGTPLAGNLAVLGDLFGSGCGTNFDLSTDGAALWLAGIPPAARGDVWYWTTSFEPGFLANCNAISGFFLSNPEDGVVEVSRGQLPGANGMGNTEGWCHTTGMSDPAQYTDQARNAEMDANAAR